MKSFKFSLMNLLNIKHTIRNVCEISKAEAQRLLIAEEEALVRIESKIEKILNPSTEDRENISASSLMQREKYLRHLQKLKKYQEDLVEQATLKVEEQAQELIDADVELKKMERNREKEYKTWEYEVQREEQKMHDEISSAFAYDRETSC